MHLYLRHAWQGASTLEDSRALYHAVGRRFAGGARIKRVTCWPAIALVNKYAAWLTDFCRTTTTSAIRVPLGPRASS